MNPDLLKHKLEILDDPGLDTFDPRLADIVALIEEGKYLEAAAQSEALLQENVFDIRIISYYLYGVFLERGIAGVVDVFVQIINLLDENFAAIGPEKRREKTIQNSLKWLLSQIVKKIQYEEGRGADQWKKWLQTSSAEVEEALTCCDGAQKSIGRTLEDLAGPLLELVTRLKSWLGTFQQLVYKASPVVEEPEVEEEEVIAEESFVTGDSVPREALSVESEFEGSYLLEQLNIKLETFQGLLAAQKYHLAAIVSVSINKILKEFDPVQHMPKLFSPYMQAYAANVVELGSQAELSETVEWQCLRELYKTDLDSFMAFDSTLLFSTVDKDLFGASISHSSAAEALPVQEHNSVDVAEEVQQEEEVVEDAWDDNSWD